MPDPIPTAIYTLITAVITAAIASIASIATSVRLLPEVIDVSIILTLAGLGAFSFTTYGALRRLDSDRIARLTLGGIVGIGLLAISLIVEVL